VDYTFGVILLLSHANDSTLNGPLPSRLVAGFNIFLGLGKIQISSFKNRVVPVE